MKTGIRLAEYIEMLLERRKKEEIKKDPVNHRDGTFSSPPGAAGTEEIRIFNEYKEQANLLRVIEAAPEKKKPFLLKRFFKMKRNQQVEVFITEGEEAVQILGKVNAVGRDFVMLTNLKDRIWLPYHSIISANIPSGIPTYSNSHQYYFYDNNLKQKLVTNFGQTVSKRDALIQQFYEETLRTNLLSWSGTWVKIQTIHGIHYGRISNVKNQTLELSFVKGKLNITLDEIVYVKSLRFLFFISLFRRRYMFKG